MHTKFKKISCSLKDNIEKSRQDSKYKKENSKTWSEKVIDTLINCFQSHECLWNIYYQWWYKDQNKKYLALKVVDMSVQEYDMNRYDYAKMD